MKPISANPLLTSAKPPSDRNYFCKTRTACGYRVIRKRRQNTEPGNRCRAFVWWLEMTSDAKKSFSTTRFSMFYVANMKECPVFATHYRKYYSQNFLKFNHVYGELPSLEKPRSKMLLPASIAILSRLCYFMCIIFFAEVNFVARCISWLLARI